MNRSKKIVFWFSILLAIGILACGVIYPLNNVIAWNGTAVLSTLLFFSWSIYLVLTIIALGGKTKLYKAIAPIILSNVLMTWGIVLSIGALIIEQIYNYLDWLKHFENRISIIRSIYKNQRT